MSSPSPSPSLFAPFALPEDIILLITDELAAPADFVLHRTLAAHLKSDPKANSNRKTVLLSVSEDIARWKALASRSNVNLQQHLDAGSLLFIDVFSEAQADPASPAPPDLRNVLERVKAFLSASPSPSSTPPLIILDDISTLSWTCSPSLSITIIPRFIRALRATALTHHATLLIRHHILSHNPNPDTDELLRHLLQIATYHLEVRPLASGRSGAVSGEISLHRGFSAQPPDRVKLIPRSSALQYRLTDMGPEFFPKGTSGGVL